MLVNIKEYIYDVILFQRNVKLYFYIMYNTILYIIHIYIYIRRLYIIYVAQFKFT